MRTKFLAFCLALACAGSTYAQSDLAVNTEAADHGPGKCLMKSDAGTWQALGLSADKSQKAQDIVARYNKDEGARKDEPGAKDKDDSYVQELKNLLTSDEYSKWQDWCAKQNMGEKNTMDKNKKY